VLAADVSVGLPGAVEVLLGEARAQQGFRRDVGRRLALRAQSPGEPLRHDQDHRRGDVEWRHPHVGEAHQRRGGIVGVQRRQQQVAGLRGLHRDLGGLEVADLADHDDVRVLPQERPQRGGEGQAGLLVDVDLVDPGHLDFRRVLGGRDVDARLVQQVEAGVERDRLAAAGRPGGEDHPVRAADRVHQRIPLLGLEAERVDADRRGRRVEDPHDDLLAEQRGQRAHAKVDRLVLGQHELHPAVLRDALLGDVELGDDLDARGELLLDHQRRLRDLHHHAVEPVADAVEPFVGLEVDVGDAGADGVEQDLLDVADDRGVVDLRVLLVGGRRHAAFDEVDLELVHAGELLQRRPGGLDQLVDRLGELVVLDDDGLDDQVGLEADLLERLEVRGVRGGDEQPVAAPVQRQHAARGGDLGVDVFLVDLVDVEGGEVEQRHAERARGEHRELAGAHPPGREHLLDKAHARGLRLGLQRFRLGLGHQPLLGERAREAADVARDLVGDHAVAVIPSA
jgi:hypothetical protein